MLGFAYTLTVVTQHGLLWYPLPSAHINLLSNVLVMYRTAVDLPCCDMLHMQIIYLFIEQAYLS